LIVIADTSALNYLLRFQRFDLFEVLYGRIVVPVAVREEMLAAGAPAEVRAWAANFPPWVDVLAPKRIDITLPEKLGSGEREAISLAIDLCADLLLMDDQAARIAAEARGLVVAGTLSLLVQASRLGMLDFAAAVEELKALGFRVSASVEAAMVRLSKL